MEDLFALTVYLRMGERIVLTGVIVLLALTVAVGFWRSMQKVEFQAEKQVGLAGNFVLATPVFVLLALVGYAWVTLNAPVSFVPAATSAPPAGDSFALADTDAFGGEFTAVIEPAPIQDDFARQQQLNKLRSLNCLMQAAPDTAAAVDTDLTEVRLDLMFDLWNYDWGDFESFELWADGRSTLLPNEAAEQLWQEAGFPCDAG